MGTFIRFIFTLCGLAAVGCAVYAWQEMHFVGATVFFGLLAAAGIGSWCVPRPTR